jgi:integrase
MARERKRRQYRTGSIVQTHTKDCPPAVPVANPKAGRTRMLHPEHACKGPWVGRFQAGWLPSGGPRILTVTAPTEAECKKRLERRMLEVADDPGNVRGGHMTVKAWADEYLPQLAARARPNYYSAESSAIRRWVIPQVGKRRLDALTPSDMRKVTAAVRAAGRASTTAALVQGAFERMLKAARADGLTVSLRALEVAHPGRAVNDRDAIPLPHALALIAQARKQPDGSRWVAAFLQGMRPAECLGLTWPAIDDDAATLDVSWQLQPLPYNRPHDTKSGFRIPDGYEVRHLVGAWHLVRPKSKAGFRVIPLVPWMATALAEWREQAPASPWGLVWPDAHGGPRKLVDDRQAWYDLQTAANVAPEDERAQREPPRYLLYEARHTTASLLLAAGVPGPVTIAIMGHSTIVSTRAYQHADRELLTAALAKVADRLAISDR